MKTLALSGFMGAGKSTLGARLARTLGCPFVDLDAEIAAAFARPVPQIFERFGEPAFRAMEARLLAQALSLPGRVVALGGGAVIDERNRELLRAHATWVQLDVPFRELARRLAASGAAQRPLWADLGAARALFDSRASIYSLAPLRIDADGAPEHVVAQLRLLVEPGDPDRRSAPTEPQRVRVDTGTSRYDIVVGCDIQDLGAEVGAIGSGPVALLSDWNVGALHLDPLKAAVASAGRDVVTLTLPAGEEHKAIRPVLEAVDRLLDHGWQRGAPVVALGGGVLGDMAGLVASLVLRGVPLVQIPTTLLAMVDSAVGGKVGVNHRRGKNLIGHFHQPELVLADLRYLDTLPDRELRAGLAEVVKTAWIGDSALFCDLESDPAAYLGRDPARLAEAVRRCCMVKARIVSEDPHERGRRAVLNLGHTVGHGLEGLLGYGSLRHGEAVAIGLVAAAALSVEGGAAPGLRDRVEGVLTGLGLPCSAPPVPLSGLARWISLDKKLKDDAVTWILEDEIGVVSLCPHPLSELHTRLERLVELGVLESSGG